MLNVISVDVEEYFHAANLEQAVGPARWHAMPSRVEHSTRRVLELFARANVRGTFFVLGHTARRYPALIREIVQQGHELASHGYGHRLAYTQSPRSYYRDVRRTKRLLEDISGEQVIGYRAPNFSIREENQWAYDSLIEAGYLYDSSLYPVWHPRYANLARNVEPEVIKRPGGQLFVFPLAVRRLALFGHELRVPVAGGAYWRLFPQPLVQQGLQGINQVEQRWFTCYFHPWELDSGQPSVEQLSLLTKLRHYGGTRRFESKLERYLARFSFGPLREAALQSFGSRFAKAVERSDEPRR